MNYLTKLFLFFIAIAVIGCAERDSESSKPDLKLWYESAATEWFEALPLGNGRLGAMVYGDPINEQFQLNESTIWGGSPYNNINPKAAEALPKIRSLIFEGKNKEAKELCNEAIFVKAKGMPYQTAGSLNLKFSGVDNYTNLYRELDLRRAVATTTFKADGVEYSRESFTSLIDGLLIIHLTASEKGHISFDANYTTPYKNNITVSATKDGEMRLDGKSDDHEGIEGKVRFTTLTKVDAEGGEVVANSDGTLSVKGADSATLYVSIGTNFVNYHDISADSYKKAQSYMKNSNKDVEEAMNEHTAQYQKYFNRVELDLGSSEQSAKNTDLRVQEFRDNFDPSMVTLYFQYGRYLLISSSQSGGEAAGLQGVWNYLTRAPWDGKYTLNINFEMNYWHSMPTSLKEMNDPFVSLVKDLSLTGRQTAAMYGCRGWAAHHNTDIWRCSGAIDTAQHGMWVTANAWLCSQLWDRYLYTGDEAFLREIYPIMKGAAQFFLDFLVQDPHSEWLVVTPSSSPEHAPMGYDAPVIAGATMDNQLVYDLFYNTIQASKIVGEDANFVDSLSTTIKRLPPMQIGSWGQLQEWMVDGDDPKGDHRHVSHLWGLMPGRQISPYATPELSQAVKTSLIARGDHSTGWSMGWKVGLWARLLNGNKAFELFSDQMTYSRKNSNGQDGGTYPNMFNSHPRFQIDGNFGGTAGIAEMLLQSHAGEVALLPALPDKLASGSVSGLETRGGFTIKSMSWKDGKIEKAVIVSNLGGVLRLRSNNRVALDGKEATVATNEVVDNPLLAIQPLSPQQNSLDFSKNKKLEIVDNYLYDIETIKGNEYVFEALK